MKKLTAIVICCILYAPTYVGLLLYTNCEIQAMIEVKEDCGCTLTTTPPNPNPLNEATTHAEIVVKTNWKYLVQDQLILLPNTTECFSNNYKGYSSPYHSIQAVHSIFHPPSLV